MVIIFSYRMTPSTKVTFYVNPCPAELFISIFHSFEAGIAYAISSFKLRKICLFMKNRDLRY